MDKKTKHTAQYKAKTHTGVPRILLVLIGILIGVAATCLIVDFYPLILEDTILDITESVSMPKKSMSDEYAIACPATGSDDDIIADSFDDKITNVSIKEIITEDLMEERLSENIDIENETKIAPDSSQNNKNMDTAENYLISDTDYVTLTTSKPCNIRTGPGVNYPSIQVIDGQCDVSVIGCVDKGKASPWYKVRLTDGTEGFISGICLVSENKTTADPISEVIPASEGKNDYASSDNNVKSPEQPVVIEVPNEKYDIRPGDYHGELMQFIGRPISEVQALFPSFTNTWFGNSGNFYDNFWTTVEFRYTDKINQIVISQCDPNYSLMGVSVGMDAETARSVLAEHGYSFSEPFHGNLGYWMHSEDEHYEVEIDIYEGKVMTMMLLDLTTVDPWWKNNGIIY